MFKDDKMLYDTILNQKVYIVCHYLKGDNQILEKFLSNFDCYEAEIANICDKKSAGGIENLSFETFSLLTPKFKSQQI